MRMMIEIIMNIYFVRLQHDIIRKIHLKMHTFFRADQ